MSALLQVACGLFFGRLQPERDLTMNRRPMLVRFVLGTLIAGVAAGLVPWFADGDREETATAAQVRGKASPATKEAEESKTGKMQTAEEALADAIACLEKKDFRRFFEYHLPVETLRDLREHATLADAARSFEAADEMRVRLLTLLKSLRDVKPTYDADRLVATFQLVDKGAAGPPYEPPAMDPTQKVPGYGDDLSTVLEKGMKALEAGEHRKFVENLYPADEVRRLKKDEARFEQLLQQLKDQPAMAKQMAADLKELQGKTIQIDGQKNTATIHLRDTGARTQARIVKFELVDGSWRFFDETPKFFKEIVRQSKLTPVGQVTTIEFERLGDRWRMVQFPLP